MEDRRRGALAGGYDPDTDSLLFGTGNPAPWNSHLRPGDNLYSSSRLALDPATARSSGTSSPRRMTAGE